MTTQNIILYTLGAIILLVSLGYGPGRYQTEIVRGGIFRIDTWTGSIEVCFIEKTGQPAKCPSDSWW